MTEAGSAGDETSAASPTQPPTPVSEDAPTKLMGIAEASGRPPSPEALAATGVMSAAAAAGKTPSPPPGRAPVYMGKGPVPDYLGGFRTFSQLPSSVLGRVFNAAAADGSHVELRLLERDDPADPGLLGRVKLAVIALEQVTHPSLARVAATGEEQGFAFYALAVPECATLLDLVRRGRPLDGAELAWLGGSLASALAALHARGLPHGDLTPVNVGIGRDGTVTLVDLGWSPRVRDPEFGLKLADATAQDMSQLAATLIYATTGQAVKASKSVKDTTAGGGKRLIERASWLTPAICELLEQLQGDPTRRPSAAEAEGRFKQLGEEAGLERWAPPSDFVEAATNLLANRSAGSDKTTASSQTGVAGAPALGAFGRYVLIEEVARGGMGVVYRARHKELDRFFALKVLLSGDLASETTRRRFLREAEAAAQLDHPSIVRVHDFGEHEGRAYIAMDFAEGQSLTLLLADPHVKLSRLLGLFARVCDAVHYAHARGIIHRDLKPQNVVVDKEDVPHILDFGVAKRVDEVTKPGQAGAGLTTEGELVGTPAYMPPEQAEGRAKDIDTRSDVYALGVILFETATRGRLPFEGLTVTDVLTKVLLEDPPAPSSIRRGLPWEVDAIVLKALEKDPNKRYQSAAEFAQDVRRFLEGHPIGARPANAWYRARKWTRRNRRLLPFIAVTVGALSLVPYFLVQAADQKRILARQQVEEHIAAGDKAVKEERLADAHTEYAAAFGIDSTSHQAWEGKNKVEFLLEREAEKREAVKKGEQDREQAAGLVLEGRKHLEAKDVDSARGAFFGALVLDPKNDGAKKGIDDTNRLAFQRDADREKENQRLRDRETAVRLVTEGNAALARQDAEAARKAFFQALGFDKDRADAQEGLRKADEIAYRETAKRDAERERERNVSEAKRLIESGRASLAAGDLPAAQRQFTQALAFDGTSSAALEGLAQIQARERERGAAVDRQKKHQDAERLVADGDKLLEKARDLQAKGDDRAAVREAYYKTMEAYDRASYLAPDDYSIVQKKCGAAGELAKIAKAQQEFGLSDYLYRIAGTVADSGTDKPPEEATDGCVVVREADAILANRAFHEALIFKEKDSLQFLAPVSDIFRPTKGRYRLRVDVRMRVDAGANPTIHLSGVTLTLENLKSNTSSAPERIDFEGQYPRIIVAGTQGREVPSLDKALKNDAPATLEKIKQRAQALLDKVEPPEKK